MQVNQSRAAVLVLVLSFLVGLSLVFQTAPRPAAIADQAQVSILTGESVRLVASAASNITATSVSGAGQYDLQFSRTVVSELDLTPSTAGTYELAVNVSGSAGNYVLVEKGIVGARGSIVYNFTQNGPIVADLVVSVNASQASGWNPLFGITGISVRGFTVPFPVIVGIILGFGVGLVLLGTRFGAAVMFIGLTVVVIAGIMVVGFLVALLALMAYVGSFTLIRVFWANKGPAKGHKP